MTFVCPGCHGLADYLGATQRAATAGRQRLEVGDGCRRCSGSKAYRPKSRDGDAQRRRARELRSGARLLICRPARVAGGHVWLLSTECTEQAAARAERIANGIDTPFEAMVLR